MEKTKNSIWIPVIVAIISGIFSITAALVSQNKAVSVKVDKAMIDSLISKSENTLEQLRSVDSRIENLPIGTIIASFLPPNLFYQLVDNRETYNQEISTWCHANGVHVIAGSDYALRTGKSHIDDLQGYFLRGLDLSGDTDPDGSNRTLGSPQLDAFQGHKHQTRVASTANSTNNNHLAYATNAPVPGTNQVLEPITDGSNGNPRVSSETRPVNKAVNYYIKIR